MSKKFKLALITPSGARIQSKITALIKSAEKQRENPEADPLLIEENLKRAICSLVNRSILDAI